MKQNVGGVDRNARIVVGVVLLIFAIAIPMSITLKIVLLAVAAIALVTAVAGFCPINALFGINTCKLAEKK
jgi:hypothetical protein